MMLTHGTAHLYADVNNYTAFEAAYPAVVA